MIPQTLWIAIYQQRETTKSNVMIVTKCQDDLNHPCLIQLLFGAGFLRYLFHTCPYSGQETVDIINDRNIQQMRHETPGCIAMINRAV